MQHWAAKKRAKYGGESTGAALEDAAVFVEDHSSEGAGLALEDAAMLVEERSCEEDQSYNSSSDDDL